MNARVRIRGLVLDQLREEARGAPGEECCGLLGGRDGVISAIFPAPNALASATEYEIAPQDLFRLVRAIREAGLEMLGIYHSHPGGENRPSARDIERACYPAAVYFIISPDPGAAHPVRAFAIRDGGANELAIEAV